MYVIHVAHQAPSKHNSIAVTNEGSRQSTCCVVPGPQLPNSAAHSACLFALAETRVDVWHTTFAKWNTQEQWLSRYLAYNLQLQRAVVSSELQLHVVAR